MRKPRPDSNQTRLTAEDSERLLEACRSMGYRDAATWAKDNLDLKTTPASLCRWYRRQTADLTTGRLRAAIKASEDFDAELDSRNLDARAANALRSMLWEAMQSGEVEAIDRLGKLVLEYVKAEGKAADLDLRRERITQQEETLKLAREKFEAAERRLATVKDELAKARTSGGITPETLKRIEEAAGLL